MGHYSSRCPLTQGQSGGNNNDPRGGYNFNQGNQQYNQFSNVPPRNNTGYNQPRGGGQPNFGFGQQGYGNGPQNFANGNNQQRSGPPNNNFGGGQQNNGNFGGGQQGNYNQNRQNNGPRRQENQTVFAAAETEDEILEPMVNASVIQMSEN